MLPILVFRLISQDTVDGDLFNAEEIFLMEYPLVCITSIVSRSSMLR